MYQKTELQKAFESLPGWFDFAMEFFDNRVKLSKEIAKMKNLDVREVYERIGKINEDDEMLMYAKEAHDKRENSSQNQASMI